MAEALPGLAIREFALDDFDEVLRLRLGAGPGVDRRPSDERDQVGLKTERDPDLFLVATKGESHRGRGDGGWGGRRAYVYHLAVTPDLRRQGVADAPMDELEDRFRAKGALKAKCQIHTHNSASLAFFRQRGWEIEEGLWPVGKVLAGRVDGSPC
ncbi:MAG TPA: GNAT family N-acetyltransferase [Thermoleophilia bacterium]|nr:GNAT family N-acetyltransferase [Thermoleophilia bacterium]